MSHTFQQQNLHALALSNPTFVARQNGFLGIAWTKEQRHARAVQKRTLYRSRYLQCKQKQLNKGKTVAPDDPKGKCKRAWKRWQKWRGKAGKRAIKLLEKAEKRGRLDPELAAALQSDMAVALNEGPPPLPPGGDLSLNDEVLSQTTPPWILLGGAAVVGTGILVLLLRR